VLRHGSRSTFGICRHLVKTGLQLDVERMFKENVTILSPFSETMDFQGMQVVMFKVAFGLCWNIHEWVLFQDGYCQPKSDAEFLKRMSLTTYLVTLW
jgi:hypothetical protein